MINSVVRSYRESLKGFNITYKESDLYIIANNKLKKKAFNSLVKYRQIIEKHIEKNPEFFTSLKPIIFDEKLEDILLSMYNAAKEANVGPFASVAGAIAEFIAKDLKEYDNNVIVENGGDIYIYGDKQRVVKIYTEKFQNIGIKVEKQMLPVAICSSSSKIGHSLSFGKADLVVVISKSGAIADAFATKICNELKDEKDIDRVIENYRRYKNLLGCLIFFNKKIAGWGDFQLLQV